MPFKTGLCLVAVLFFSLFFFQNCGQYNSGLQANGSENETQTAPDGSFFAGDPFDPALVPFDLTDQGEIDGVNGYIDRTGFKAMAFTQDGDLYIDSSTDMFIESQADWDEAVLERCQLTNMNKPCSLFASGDLMAQNRDEFLIGFKSVIVVPTTFDGNLVPGGINFWQNFQNLNYPVYSGSTQFKAFSISANGAQHSGWSNVSQEEANRRSLEFCESISDNFTCSIYAEQQAVVFDLENYQWQPQRVLYGPRLFNVDEIPFITEERREAIRTQYPSNNHYVLVMDRYGNNIETQSSTLPASQAQIDQMLKTCSAAISSPQPGSFQRTCFVYSIDDEVVLTRQEFRDTSLGY